MPAPIVTGLSIEFPANSFFSAKTGPFAVSRYAVNAQTITLDACTAGTETRRMYWKYNLTTDPFVTLDSETWVKRTAISNASATLYPQGTAIAAGNVGVHPRGKIYSKVGVSGNGTQLADVTFSYKKERYDLLELDVATGVVYVKKGTEQDFTATSGIPTPTPGRYPLFHAYVWNDTIELIHLHTWVDGMPALGGIKRVSIDKVRARNQTLLAAVKAKLDAGQPVTIQGYGDSITAQGGGWANTGNPVSDTTWMASSPNGFARDSEFYYEYMNAEDEAAWGPFFTRTDAHDPGTARHHNNGWTARLATQLAADYGSAVTLKNWGIGATTASGGIDGVTGRAGGAHSSRLVPVSTETADVVFVCFAMNDFVGFAVSGGLRAPLAAIVNSLKTAQPNRAVVLLGVSGLNAENANSNGGAYTWWFKCQDTYRQVAMELGCAYIPMELIHHGGAGFMGLSTQSYAGVNRYNHPMPYECSMIAKYIRTCLAI